MRFIIDNTYLLNKHLSKSVIYTTHQSLYKRIRRPLSSVDYCSNNTSDFIYLYYKTVVDNIRRRLIYWRWLHRSYKSALMASFWPFSSKQKSVKFSFIIRILLTYNYANSKIVAITGHTRTMVISTNKGRHKMARSGQIWRVDDDFVHLCITLT